MGCCISLRFRGRIVTLVATLLHAVGHFQHSWWVIVTMMLLRLTKRGALCEAYFHSQAP